MRHKLDYKPIPEDVLYINELDLADSVPYETKEDTEKALTGKRKKEGGVLPDDNVRIYAVYFPELTSSISITLVLLFSSTINTSAARAMSREEKALEVTKYIPVKIKDIFLAKLLIPLILSFISLLITCLTLNQ